MEKTDIFGIIHKVDNQIKRELDRIALGHGLTGIQAFFLKYIYDNSIDKEIFQKDIENVFDIRRSSVSTMMSCMEKKGYIKRESILEDKRVKRIVLTESGLDKHMKVHHEICEYKKRLLNDLSDEEVELVYNLLIRISDKTKKY